MLREVRGSEQHALMTLTSGRPIEKASRVGSEVLCSAPNESLQRTGTHKVLARGRALTLWAGAVRPRAPTGRRAVAKLNS
jgi:hypothetical protein